MRFKALDYKDVSLVPRHVSTLASRDDKTIDISTNICGIKLDLPVIASPMKDVCNYEVANIMRKHGGLGILHRFCTIDEQVDEFLKVNLEGDRRICGCAIGINNDYFQRLEQLYDFGCRIFVLDVANGANTNIIDPIALISNEFPDANLIVGNVASCENFRWLSDFGNVYGIRVGIGGGGGCTTRNSTGIYHPAISLIDEIHKCCHKRKSAIIADGGIREIQDVCKALVFGANAVMLGGLIASCYDSPAQIDPITQATKIYRGSASFDIQSTFREPRYVEGKTVYMPPTDNVSGLLNKIKDGLLSSMSYFNARDLNEYRRHLSYVIL